MTDIIKKAEEFAKKRYSKNDSHHQWIHVEAVLNRALEISKDIGEVDYEALKLAIIFHDIDYTSYEAHVDASVNVAEEFLKKNKYPSERIEKIKEIMLNHSSPHRAKLGDAVLIEGKIIFDADKSLFLNTLDAYNKYYPLLYLNSTKKLIKKPVNK